MTTVHATARLQFHSKFTLDHAVPLVPYLKGLGISHVYASPLLKSRAGSTHGYDIVDHGTIDAEVGGEA
jgi:(1->4)-alpha-D-glucan 1-alpha-D-glucosylmutase